ncbi:Retrovirus-related Pol polyprotein from type-2 retrotransposable element R2DM [Portunus trituberculatus]|uniref:Retrovirus-related Pol polyprotein from type-2 retrotransposable element R2DM n=1 Tax=Portunus trituberculatus TaxID=210409 RepID=A0A5B7GAJ2_PORTR|nr:Retrovirus-related Pol polyprotein from type-2 retrotransposable element R2DM [Portunus trituberculatus]
MSALLQEDDDDAELITEEELRRALSQGKASSPGDDGITCAVFRLLQQVPGNPLLRLYNLCLLQGCAPRAWTSSTIIPIPKPGTAKFRPISLTSCFCKRSTHHCLVDLYSRLSRDSVVAFVDLKSAFDVANRDIILDQLVAFGIKGNLLSWIRGYLSNRNSRVFFSGASSQSRDFHLGTPQGVFLARFCSMS